MFMASLYSMLALCFIDYPVLSKPAYVSRHDKSRVNTMEKITQLNLLLAWLWILLGFGSGFALGANFHREDWLGGYGSYKRRLYRLGHISFFGLGLLNLMFYFTARQCFTPNLAVRLASSGFLLGAISMPVCCLIMAHRSTWRALFLIPVGSLIGAGLLTLWEITKL
jgi:hypothetical protein